MQRRYFGVLCILLSACAGLREAPSDDNEARDRALLTAVRPIAARSSPWLEKLTWLEVRDLIADGTSTVVVPSGGIEQNGPYLATGKHNLILEGSCPAIAQKLGNALCAPVVKLVPKDNPGRAVHFPGSINVRADTYVALLKDIVASLRQTGFRDIVLIGDSGGTQDAMEKVAADLNRRWADTTTRVHFVREYYDPGWEATERYTEEELGIAETRHDGYHDDIWVTAMMMVSDPEQVRHEERVAAKLASINGLSIESVDETVELGRKMIAFRADLTAAAIRAAIAERKDPQQGSHSL